MCVILSGGRQTFDCLMLNCKEKKSNNSFKDAKKLSSVYEDTNLAVGGFNLYFNDYDNDNDDEKSHLVFVRI